MDQGLAPRDAAEQTIARLEGAFALAFLFEGEDDLIVAARKGSPLAVGHGDGEMFLGSDAIALAPMTDRITYLEEGDRAVLTRKGVEIVDARGNRANRPVRTIQIDTARVDKAGHKHFMAKEIAEQPTVVSGAIAHYVPETAASRSPKATSTSPASTASCMVACGTAFFACLIARYWFERVAGLPGRGRYRLRIPLPRAA